MSDNQRPWRIFFRSMVMTVTVLLLAVMSGRAQDAAVDTVAVLPGVVVETAVDRAEAYVGDLITYMLTISFDSSFELIPPPLGANLGAFDVKDYRPDVETSLPDGRRQSQTTFVLSTFTTGDYVIPPLPVLFELPDSTRKALLAEAVPITILSLLEAEGDSLDIKPLKAPYEFPRDYQRYYLWGGLGLAVLILGLVGWWWWRRKHRQGEQIDLRPPWEIASEQLAFLKEEYLAQPMEGQERNKAYYLALTEIVRAFLERVYRVDVLEMTTEQFVAEFAEGDLPDELYEELTGFFRHADQVKFAKWLPAEGKAQDDFEVAHRTVDRVRRDQQQRLAVVGQNATEAPSPEEKQTV